jgi:hypothetical protein
MPSLDRGSSSRSFCWRRCLFSRMTRRNKSHVAQEQLATSRIFHGRTLQNQMRSLLIHHSTSAATAPVNLETWQRSGAQVEPKNSVLTLLVELLVIFGIFQSFDWAHRIVFPTSPLVLIIFEQSKVCLRFVLSPHRCLGIINYTSLEPGGETTVSLRFVVCTIMIFTVRISNLPKGLWIQPWFFC